MIHSIYWHNIQSNNTRHRLTQYTVHTDTVYNQVMHSIDRHNIQYTIRWYTAQTDTIYSIQSDDAQIDTIYSIYNHSMTIWLLRNVGPYSTQKKTWYTALTDTIYITDWYHRLAFYIVPHSQIWKKTDPGLWDCTRQDEGYAGCGRSWRCSQHRGLWCWCRGTGPDSPDVDSDVLSSWHSRCWHSQSVTLPGPVVVAA